MNVRVKVKAGRKTHEVTLADATDEADAGRQALTNLQAYADLGQIKLGKNPKVVSVEFDPEP
jgi:hypothetical protein